jgi:hypothetical protein
MAGTPVHMSLFVLEGCPYGDMALERLIPLAKAFPERIDFQVFYLGNLDQNTPAAGCLPEPEQPFNTAGTAPSAATEDNLSGSRREVIIREYYPEVFLDYLSERLQAGGHMAWPEAARKLGIDTGDVERCIAAGEADAFLKSDFETADSLNIHYSPALVLDGQVVDAPLHSVRFFRHWCEKFGHDHSYCRALPECITDLDCPRPEKYCDQSGIPHCAEVPGSTVELTILDSRICRSCSHQLVLSSARQLLPRLTIQMLDIEQEEGRRLAEQLDLERLPAYLFSSSIKEATPVYQRIKPILLEHDRGCLLDPEVTDAPVLWKRPGQQDRLEFWFNGESEDSLEAEAFWKEYIKSLPGRFKVEFHYFPPAEWLERPLEWTLQQGKSENTLEMRPQINSPVLQFLQRRGLSPARLMEDAELLARRPFISGQGGALLHNKLWISSWSPGTIQRVLFELEPEKALNKEKNHAEEN